jgi:uncharacterized protein
MRGMRLALLAGIMAGQMAAGAAMADAGKITVTGEGRVEAAPDIATIALGVQVRGDTAAAALAANSERLAAVLARLKAAGIADRDLQTSGLGLGPEYDHSRAGQPPRVVGYQATNMLTVRVRDLARLGAVLDQAVADGANTLNGLVFGLAEPQAALDKARVAAVQDARRKAEMMAAAAGVALGAVLEMSESHGGGPQPYFRGAPMAMDAAAVPVEGGEVSLSVQVSITWEIKAP